MNKRDPLFWMTAFLQDKPEIRIIGMRTPLSQWMEIPAEKYDGAFFATISGRFSGSEFTSPNEATFGGIFVNGENSQRNSFIIPKLVDFIHSEYGAKSFSILLPSSHLYNSDGMETNSTVPVFLTKTIFEDLNFAVNLRTWSENDLSKGNRKKLRQCRELGITTRELEKFEVINAYELIAENRKRLGVIPSISLDSLLALLDRFPTYYKVYGTYLKSELIAAAMVVETHRENNYVFMWGHVETFENYSPVVSLFVFLVEASRQSGYKYLDLGTSSSKGIVNEGLVRFKMNLGAIEYSKFMVGIDF